MSHSRFMRHHSLGASAGVLLALLGGIVPAVHADTFVVTKTADTNDGACDADCSLREAVVAANASPGADSLTLPAGTYPLAIAGRNEDAAATGDLDITGDLALTGAGAAMTTVDASGLTGGNSDRVFHVLAGVVASIDGVTISGGAPDGTIVFERNGGGISNEGTLTVTSSIVTGNTATNGGGGMYNDIDAVLTVNGSTISGNSADGGGGGLFNFGGALTLANSTISGNSGFDGGGINSGTGGVTPGILTLSNTDVVMNEAARDGGAVHNGSPPAAATIDGGSFSNNTSERTGGAINNNGGLTIEGAVFLFNTAVSTGGAIDNASTATTEVAGSTFSSNSGFGGGAIYNAGNLTVSESTFSDNSVTNRFGGGISNDGDLTVTTSTFDANFSVARPDSLGGGLYVGTGGSAEVVNSTFAFNQAVSGGGIYSFGALDVHSSTISGNSTSSGGSGLAASIGTTSVAHTIVAGNSGNDCFGTITSLGYNLEDSVACGFTSTGDQQNADPVLGPLLSNGGPTETLALLSGSDAIDAGNPLGCLDPDGIALILDQRGYVRVVDGNMGGPAVCDVGAFEAGSDMPGACGLLNHVVTSNLVIDSTELFEACLAITVGPAFLVENGGDVTFRAGEMILFTNGFSMEAGSQMTVEIDPSLSGG